MINIPKNLKLGIKLLYSKLNYKNMQGVVRYIGIDFGTSTSIVSYLDYEEVDGKLKPLGHPKVVDYSGGQGITAVPTIVKKADEISNEDSYGCDVPEFIINKYPDKLYREFKMNLGSNVSPEERNKAIDLMNGFMKYLAKGYCSFEKGKETNVLKRLIHISYPAKWEINQKSLTQNAANEAFKDLGEVRAFDEPAAALFFCLNSEKIETSIKRELSIDGNCSNILIIDLGAGTADMVLYKYNPTGSSTVLAKYPEPTKESITFGGREIDQKIYDFLLKNYRDKIDEDEQEQHILAECKRWKEEFSKGISYGLKNNINETTNRLPFKIKIKQEDGFYFDAIKLCDLLKDYLSDFPKLINGIIEEAKLNHEGFKGGEDIDFVILTGGNSQWFFIEKMLKGIWVNGLDGNETTGSGIDLPKIKKESWRLITTSEPQHIVSYGLSFSGVKPPVVYRSNSSVRLKIKLGEGNPEYIDILKKNDELPKVIINTLTFKSKIKREDKLIPIEIITIIGAKNELDPISVQVDTHFLKDVAIWAVDEAKRYIGISVPEYRRDEIALNFTINLDENQVMSLSGSTSGGNTDKAFSLNSTNIAKIIKESLNK